MSTRAHRKLGGEGVGYSGSEESNSEMVEVNSEAIWDSWSRNSKKKGTSVTFDPVPDVMEKDSNPKHNKATLPGDSLIRDRSVTNEEDERAPLLLSGDSGGYGIVPSRDSDRDDDDSRTKGRYTPVRSIFNHTTDLSPKPSWELPHKDYDSLDYDICYNVPYKAMLREYTQATYNHMEVLRWVLVCIIGLLTGVVAFLIDICVKQLFSLKYSVFQKVLDATSDDGRVVLAFLVLLGFNVCFAIIAAALIAYRPVAAGSGIPEIKCYLNGVKVPHVTRLGTLIAKAIGVLFSVAGGFLVGKEGPMIHSGAIIGAGIPQFRSLYFNWLKFPYPYFRSDRDKRDFVSSGAAAGVAAAFGSPIGGVLFSLEEGSSFWNQALTWRTLFCCFSSTFILNFLVSIYNGSKDIGYLASPGLVDFGVFSKDEGKLWNVYHLVIFVIMGAIGGLLGALFNSLNVNLTKYRMKYLANRRYSRGWRVLEVILIAMVTTTTVFLVAMLLGTCLQSTNLDSTVGSNNTDQTRDFFCPGHSSSGTTKSYYNDMATLMFNSQEIAIKQLFHQNGAFTLPTLLILFIVYFFIACWTYGASIPSGLFIPCLMIGATYGRFVATIFAYLNSWQPTHFYWLTTLYPGTYALIGAASFLGGVVRMTISLTVILIESTNEIEYGLPIMLTVMVAKWVGDYFNKGLYDTHIQLKKTPFLEWESPLQLDKLVAEDVMNSSSTKLTYLYPITRVRSIERILRTTVHSAFPVVTPVSASSIPVFPKNIKSQHTPQLYTRRSVMGVGSPALHSPPVRIRNPIAEEYGGGGDDGRGVGFDLEEGERDGRGVDFDLEEGERDGRGFVKTYTIPKNMASDEEDSDEELGGSLAGKQKLVFRGLILRHQLVMLLKNKVFFNEADGPKSQKEIDMATLTAEYPRYSDIYALRFTETERNMLMDLSIFMNPSPYTISREAPLPQVFNLFRTMGLRHLPVMQESGIVVGLITRHDLTHEALHDILHEKKDREASQSHDDSSVSGGPHRGARHEERFRSLNADREQEEVSASVSN